jgi:hypothetical protein
MAAGPLNKMHIIPVDKFKRIVVKRELHDSRWIWFVYPQIKLFRLFWTNGEFGASGGLFMRVKCYNGEAIALSAAEQIKVNYLS